VNHETFLDIFFGTGNQSWPGRDPASKTAAFLAELLTAFTSDTPGLPYILPRNEPGQQNKYVYVIPRDARQANTVREWLNAFVVPSYATFADRIEPLRPGDPIDDAVAAFAGHRRVLVLEHDHKTARDLWIVLKRMHRAIKNRPAVQWNDIRPVGRLLTDFDVAMAAGDHRTAAELLTRLEGVGLGAMNITYLTVKRLARMGRHSELLRLPQLRDVVATRPPVPVREAILDALHSTLAARPIADGDLTAARTALARQAALAPGLADGPLTDLSAEALTVLALTAAETGDVHLWRRLRADEVAWTRLAGTRAGVAEYVESSRAAFQPQDVPDPAPALVQPLKAEETPAPVPTPSSWPELVEAIAEGRDMRPVLAEEKWRSWEPAAASDKVLADLLNGLDNDSAERAWDIVGAFVEADGFRQPASRTARAFLINALTYSRFHFSDMAGIVALLEIALRGGLAAGEYSLLLGDIAAESARWVSVNNAAIVLDMCDAVARAASPDPEARKRIADILLAPLADQRSRLEPDQLALARIIDDELRLGLPWDVEKPPQAASAVAGIPRKVLLYSLDEGVLRRAVTALHSIAPALTVKTSSDHVGSPRLKQWVKGADIVVMATRCATHAATGFIRAEAGENTVIREADGAGSASLLRAVSEAL
jgi:hypothetical protein